MVVDGVVETVSVEFVELVDAVIYIAVDEAYLLAFNEAEVVFRIP